MLFGQSDRPPAAFSRPGKRPQQFGHRLVCQADELQGGPSHPARQRHAVFQVPPGLLEPGRPVLGDA
jgi:hypothetical protein